MDWEPFVRVGLAALLAAPIGLDRELRGKPAGLRTHVLVSVASAAFGYVSVLAAGGAANDETRIAAQVVSGIGFLGAGVIFASGNRVHGLTTAAALWAVSAIGLCVGLGSFVLGVATAAVTAVVLSPLDWATAPFIERFGLHELTFTVIVSNIGDLDVLQTGITDLGGRIRNMEVTEVSDAVAARILVRCGRSQAQRIGDYLMTHRDVLFTSTSTVEAFE